MLVPEEYSTIEDAAAAAGRVPYLVEKRRKAYPLG
jgi:hypothetical protein